MQTHTESFPSTRDAAADATTFVMDRAEAAGLPESILEALLLATGEAVPNAVRHGNGLDPDKRVLVELVVNEREVRLSVQDEGSGVPEKRLEHAELPEDPLQTNGRGLFIMKTLADRIWLEENGRRLCMAWTRDDESEQ